MTFDEMRQEWGELRHALRDAPSTHNPKHPDYHYWFAVRTRWARRARKLECLLLRADEHPWQLGVKAGRRAGKSETTKNALGIH